MRILSISLVAAATLTGWLSTAQAEDAGTVAIPDKARANILKRHPQALDLQASLETHFGQQLIEVRFKDADDQLRHELYRTDGAFFSTEFLREYGLDVTAEVIKALKDNFGDYRIEKGEVVVNPNGAGEEYELYLATAGGKWKVAINDKGTITAKDRY